MGSSTTVETSGTQTRTLSPQEIDYNNKQLAILDKQLSAIQQSNDFQQGVFNTLQPIINDYGTLLKQQVGDINDPVTQQILQKSKDLQLQQLNYASDTLPIQKELLQAQLDQIKSGGAATPEQQALIDKYTQAALSSGTTDINRFVDTTAQKIRNELTPARGLRPTDTPITNIGDLTSAEATRQYGQLESNLQAANAAAKINLPLAISQLTGAQNTAQQNINLATQNFSNTLAQNAATNRLNISGLLGNTLTNAQTGGVGLARISPSSFFPSGTTSYSGTQTVSQGFGLGSILSGTGSLLSGLGAVGFFSSRRLKQRIAAADGTEVLRELAAMDIDHWNYKGKSQQHVGPYAEDFRDAFGLGDGVTIPIIDALGVLFAAVKELAQRQEAAA